MPGSQDRGLKQDLISWGCRRRVGGHRPDDHPVGRSRLPLLHSPAPASPSWPGTGSPGNLRTTSDPLGMGFHRALRCQAGAQPHPFPTGRQAAVPAGATQVGRQSDIVSLFRATDLGNSLSRGIIMFRSTPGRDQPGRGDTSGATAPTSGRATTALAKGGPRSTATTPGRACCATSYRFSSRESLVVALS